MLDRVPVLDPTFQVDPRLSMLVCCSESSVIAVAPVNDPSEAVDDREQELGVVENGRRPR